MPKRVVQKTFTFEQQRQEINLLADDVNNTELLDTVNKDSIVESINEVIDTPEDEIFIEENDTENVEKPLLFADSIVLSADYATSKPNISPSTNPNSLDYATLGYDNVTNGGVTYNPALKTVTAGNFQGNVKNEIGEVILDVADDATELSQYTGLLKSARQDSVAISSATYLNNIVTVTTLTPHNLDPGNIIDIQGFTPIGYNTAGGQATQSDYGDVVIETLSPFIFTYFRNSDPGVATVQGSLVKQVPIDIRENLQLISQAAKLTLERTSSMELVTGIDDGAFVNVTNSDKVIYVNANDENASDAVDNNGRNLNRPFKSIERALLEAGKRSYVAGVGGGGYEQGEPGADLFEYFSIILFPGEYIVDNTPGDADQLNVLAETDDAYKTTAGFAGEISRFNPVSGGVIVPRGTSIVGLDLRKTIIRPKYVPDADSGERSAIFRLTGGCYIWQFTVKDDLNTEASHHKLTVFEYASYDDLTLYYEKVDVFSELNQILGDDYSQRVEENRIVGFVQSKDTADTVASASPYVFNISLRSVWGMCGLHADGSRATGLKSMVLAQYTGISLQKDDRAFIYNGATTTLIDDPDSRHSESLAEYRYDWRHYHIKSSNNGFLQVVSVFAVGQADHFMAETGGDHSITNSNSNFGNRSISCISHRPEVFKQDDGGYVIGILPPRGLDPDAQSSITINDIDFKSTLKKYSDALKGSSPGEFRKIYVSVGGQEFITQDDVPEFYSTYDGTDRAELLIDDINYLLGKREYSDTLPEAIYANLPKNYDTPTIQTFGARLRDNEAPSVQAFTGSSNTPIQLDPQYSYSQGIIETFNVAGTPKTTDTIEGPIATFSLYTDASATTPYAGDATGLNTGLWSVKPSTGGNATATFTADIGTGGGAIDALVISSGRIAAIEETSGGTAAVAGSANYNITSAQYTTTSTLGTGAQFDVYRRDGVYIVYILNAGNNYELGDTFTISGAELGGVAVTNDLTITVTALNTSGSNYVVGNVFALQIVDDASNSYVVYARVDSVVLPRNVRFNTSTLLTYISPTNPTRDYILEGDGFNAEINVRVVPTGGTGTAWSVQLIDGGSGFRPSEVLLLPGSFFSGDDTGTNDVIFEVLNVTGATILTRNVERKFYGWEYARTVNGEYLGRLCLLVDDFREGGIQTVYGIPTTFDYTPVNADFTGFEASTTVEQIATATREETIRSRTITSITPQGGASYLVTVSFPHGFYPGNFVTLSNVDPFEFDIIDAEIDSVPTGTTFVISIPSAAQAGATYSSGGTASVVSEEKTVSVRIVINTDINGNGQIDEIYPFDYDTALTEAQNLLLTGNWLSSGSGFVGELTQGGTTEIGDTLTINIGPGTSLIPVVTSTSIPFTVATTVDNQNSPFSSEDIKEDDYLETSAAGTRYGALDPEISLELQRDKNLSLLRRLTQRIDSNADGGLDATFDSFEFNENTINNLYIRRIQDARSANGNSELLWRLIYKVPKTGFGNIKLRGPESKFVIQLKDPSLRFPYTYKEETDPDYLKYPESFYVSNVEVITEYKYNVQDGYYLLTILDGNVYLDTDEVPVTNDIQYTRQRLVGLDSSNEIEHIYQDGSDLIENSFQRIQEEVFGYMINKYPYIYFADDAAESNRYKDASRLILLNKDEIQDRSLAELALNYDEVVYGTDWFIPGDIDPAVDSEQGGRALFYDAYRLIQLNKDEIISTAYNAIAAAFPLFVNPNPTKCQRDIGYFIDAVSLDLFLFGNKYVNKFIEKYYDANGNPINGGLEGEEAQSIVAFNSARDQMILAMRNLLTITDATVTVDTNLDGQGVCANVASAINTLTLLVTNVLDDTTPFGTEPEPGDITVTARDLTTTVNGLDLGSIKCRRDIGYFVDSTIRDLATGGNAWTVEYTELYFSGPTTLIVDGVEGELPQTIDSLEGVREFSKQAMRNQLYFQDLTITADPTTGSNRDPGSCADVATAIDNIIGIPIDAFTGPVQTPTQSGVTVSYGNGVGEFGFSDSAKCKRDVGYILKAIIKDLRLGGNAQTVDAAKFYFAAAAEQFIDGELQETRDAYDYLEDLTISAMRNWDTYQAFGQVPAQVAGNEGIVTVNSTKGLLVGMTIRQIDRLPTTPTQYQTPPYTIPANTYNGNAEYTVNVITTNIPSGLFIQEIIDETTIRLGDTRFGLPYNNAGSNDVGLVQGNSLYFYFRMEQFMGLNWTQPGTTAPDFSAVNSQGDTVLEDFYNQANGANGWTGGPLAPLNTLPYECSDVRQTLITQFTLIDQLLGSKSMTLSSSGLTATATVPSGHGLTGSPTIHIFGAEQNVFNGNRSITVIDDNTFTYTLSTVPDVSTDYGRLVVEGSIVRTEPQRSTYELTDQNLTGIGYSQNINYLYPETDLDNPKWNPKPSVSRYNAEVGNCTLKTNNLVLDGYERVTQYSITAEGMKNFLNNVLSGGDLASSTEKVPFSRFNSQFEYGISSFTDADIVAPYQNPAIDLYGVDKSPVLEFDSSNNPIFTDRCLIFKIPVPVSLFRPSIIRASSHTWEYVGFGPGNYSTGLPQFQDITLTQQQTVNSQSLEKAGGFVASSGTNSQGDFFIGNQIIDAKGNNTNTLNFPRLKTSAENRLIDFTDLQSLAANSSSTAFTPSRFSKSLTEVLSAIQEAQRNAFKAANIESSVLTTNSLKVNGKIVISNNVFDNVDNFPEGRQDRYGFVKRASINWFNNDSASEEYEALADTYISPVDLSDWANKNSLIPSTPVPWTVAYTPEGTFSEASDVGIVDIIETFKKSSNFSVSGINATDNRWYEPLTDTVQIPLGTPRDSEDQTGINLYEGRSGIIYVSFSVEVKASAIIPTNLWVPVDNNWNGISEEDGSPTSYLQGKNFIIGYYVTGGKIYYSTNVVTEF